MKKVIIFLIRRRLRLKAFEGFRFVGQKSKDNWYYFTKTELIKVMDGQMDRPSSVSLHWILNDECQITKIGVRAASR